VPAPKKLLGISFSVGILKQRRNNSINASAGGGILNIETGSIVRELIDASGNISLARSATGNPWTMYLQASGNVGIGTTSPDFRDMQAGRAVGEKLVVMTT
jgi:hypothetical protein